MYIKKSIEGTNLYMSLEGRLDKTTASQLKDELEHSLEGVKCFRLDLSGLESVSEASIRVLYILKREMEHKGGTFVIYHPSEAVKELFEATSIADTFDIVLG